MSFFGLVLLGVLICCTSAVEPTVRRMSCQLFYWRRYKPSA